MTLVVLPQLIRFTTISLTLLFVGATNGDNVGTLVGTFVGTFVGVFVITGAGAGADGATPAPV